MTATCQCLVSASQRLGPLIECPLRFSKLGSRRGVFGPVSAMPKLPPAGLTKADRNGGGKRIGFQATTPGKLPITSSTSFGGKSPQCRPLIRSSGNRISGRARLHLCATSSSDCNRIACSAMAASVSTKSRKTDLQQVADWWPPRLDRQAHVMPSPAISEAFAPLGKKSAMMSSPAEGPGYSTSVPVVLLIASLERIEMDPPRPFGGLAKVDQGCLYAANCSVISTTA